MTHLPGNGLGHEASTTNRGTGVPCCGAAEETAKRARKTAGRRIVDHTTRDSVVDTGPTRKVRITRCLIRTRIREACGGQLPPGSSRWGDRTQRAAYGVRVP